ncbi:hypothetical protein DUNSADRAFT_4528 [Dunaliella salina]|uniref:Uncharacterized protein n=1 Tax=Dunaliella salina TaxID=3046 RepID=A0ABQ7GRU8_DUNSA|nr:hypothetical protein DUNSADRAFT_4528 [Dunaliella salina]|eukprot:KAF5837320.1 hypothetical protein DUNSADRAFT_4528 [Dunaliella salina]
MHGLPGEDDEDGLRQGSHHNPDKELLQQLWQEHHKALADAREAERKRAIESRFEIAGPRSRSKGAPAAATGAAAEEQDSWEKQLGKVQTPGARQAVLRTLLKNNNHPMNQPSMPVKKSKPLSPAPPHTQNPSNGGTRPSLTNEPPKLPPASPAPAPLKDTKSATDVSKAQALWRRAALQQPLGKGGDREVQQQQQQQQQQRRGQGGGGQQLTSEKASGLKPTHPHQQQATASQAQHAALPSFSAKLMSKAHGRQRAAAFPHGVHGRPATAVGHEDTGASSLHSHQQQLRQQQQQLRHEAQGWWDPSFHDDTNDTAHGAVVAGVDGATYGSAGGEMAAAGAGGPDDAEGQHSYTSRQHTLPGSAEGAVQGAGAKRLEVDANVLTEEDLAYVTVQVGCACVGRGGLHLSAEEAGARAYGAMKPVTLCASQ